MATPVIMPRQGQSVESCIIAKWNKKKGDAVAIGDVLFSYETDKASFEETAKVGGTLLETFFEEGDDVPCLLNVCVIGNPGEDVSAFQPAGDAEEQAAPATEEQPAAAPAPSSPAPAVECAVGGGEVKISPRARHLAEKSCANLNLAQGSGPHGRVIERDVERLIAEGKISTYAAQDAYAASGADVAGSGVGGRVTLADLAAPAPAVCAAAASDQPEFEEVKLTNIRKVIAKSMHSSLATMAQLTFNTTFDATAILNYRKVLKAKGEAYGMEKVTINDMILYAVSRVLLHHKDLNAYFADDKMTLFNNVHLGVATDTERGLMVPTVFYANRMSLKEISDQAKIVCSACRDGACNPDLLKGATFTVSNLGSMGVESFTPVINPPQTGILGVCSVTQRIREVDGEIKTYPAMGLSITFDHRAIDGAPVARFLQELCTALENFTMLLGA